MTRECTKELLPLIQAWAEGKTIQVKLDGEDNFIDVENVLSFDWEREGLVYRIKPEPKYVPFDSTNEVYEAIRKHGAWVHRSFEDYEEYYAINTICKDGVLIGGDEDGNERDFDEIVLDFVWADDGTPCGKLVNADNRADLADFCEISVKTERI